MFSGPTPYSLMDQQVSEPPGSLRARRPDLSADLERLVLHLLEKNPGARPASAQAVYVCLLPFVVSLGPLAGAGAADVRQPDPHVRPGWWAGCRSQPWNLYLATLRPAEGVPDPWLLAAQPSTSANGYR